MQMEILMYVPNVTDISTRTEVLINILDRVIWRTKSLMFKHHMKERKTRQTIKHLMTQILRFRTFQLHHCDINKGNYQNYLLERNQSVAYEKIVYCKKNIFLWPSGQAGKSFVDEMSWLMNEWIRESPLKDIAFKAIMVMPGLLLQKPSRKSKWKDHLTSLENRIKLWHAGEIMALLKEAETIQGGNRKYVWFASFWDEKLGTGGRADKKIPYF